VKLHRVSAPRRGSPGQDHLVTGRSCSTPSTTMSTFSLKNATRFSIFGASGIGAA
jgi:hypothetical protein